MILCCQIENKVTEKKDWPHRVIEHWPFDAIYRDRKHSRDEMNSNFFDRNTHSKEFIASKITGNEHRRSFGGSSKKGDVPKLGEARLRGAFNVLHPIHLPSLWQNCDAAAKEEENF